MAEVDVTTASPMRLVDPDASSGHERIDNGARGRATVVSDIERELVFLAASHRVCLSGMCRPVTISNGATKTFRFRLGLESYTKFVTVTAYVTATNVENGDTASIAITSTTDGTGVTLTVTGDITDDASSAMAYSHEIQVASDWAAIDFSTLSNAYEDVEVAVTAPAGGSDSIKIYSITFHQERARSITL
jgi:hypothetical protein